MMLLDELASRQRFGIRPGLDTIRAVCAALGDPQQRFPAIHVAGTNGKGAVCAILDAALREAGLRIGRYTSPHLVRINERFFLDGAPVGDDVLEQVVTELEPMLTAPIAAELTFFEALTAVTFALYAREQVDMAVLECGLGGRLDATNICKPSLCVITKIGLDHCDWLGSTVEQIASEKAGIIKPGVPVVLGRNDISVRTVISQTAARIGAPFYYAPDLVSEDEIPADFALAGAFNRENAVTALAALKILAKGKGVRPLLDGDRFLRALKGFSKVVWPGRFQRLGNVLIDGAHNPPAARALVAALRERGQTPYSLTLIAGFCGDKEVEETLRILAPLVRVAFAVRTNNPRSLAPDALSAKMKSIGISAIPCDSLESAISQAGIDPTQPPGTVPAVLICGSLFLAGEALVLLGDRSESIRFDPSEALTSLQFTKTKHL